jgi:hypothetical protein
MIRDIQVGVLAVLLAAPAFAQTQPADKSRFTLLNPTPTAQMREMTTDRPDVTESPYTVDAGHLQIESSFVEYTHDDTDATINQYSILPSNFRLGITSSTEVAVNFQPYLIQNIKAGGTSQSTSGFGFTELRFKANLWGNDGDAKTAFGIMPLVQLPTGPNAIGTDEVQPGVAALLTVKLTDKIELGFMGEVNFVRGPDDPSYQTEFVHTATISFPIVEELDGFAEYAGVTSTDSTYAAQLDLGLTYGLSENIQLDSGIFIGLSDAADDFTVFAGMSVRL